MMDRFRNELILLVALLVMIAGIAYRYTLSSRLDATVRTSQQAAREVREIAILKQVWGTQGIQGKVAKLRELLPAARIKTFDQKKSELRAVFSGLNGAELNTIATALGESPLRIRTMSILRSGQTYTVRCRCTW